MCITGIGEPQYAAAVVRASFLAERGSLEQAKDQGAHDAPYVCAAKLS